MFIISIEYRVFIPDFEIYIYDMRKFSEKINESMDDRDPIDPSEDAKEFKEKFGDANSFYRINSMMQRELDLIEISYPTMTDEYDVYKISELDDSGRDIRTVGYFRAVSKTHARIKASVAKNRSDIFATGYFGAENAGASMAREMAKLEKEIADRERLLDQMRNPI